MTDPTAIAGGVLEAPDSMPDAVSAVIREARVPAAVPPTVLVFRENRTYNRLRRCFDVIGAVALLALATPILFVAGIAILLEDGRPIFFQQRRVGRFGRLFTIYKLRTMRKEKCVDSFSPTTGRDPRITRVGYWLRKSSIDELPQLMNIIRGEMAFVGPRPEMPFVVREYQAWQNLRHLVTPGVTGFWQTTCRSTVPLHMPQATMLDIDYIRKASHTTDAAVLVKTIRSLISAEGAF
jgi:lipopolysaccharide/colanic/teichoic acid biosynthesis glycosyltransferase